MKRLSFLLMAVAFLYPKVANAQDGKGSINFVPYVGVNYSDFSGDASYYFGETSGKVNLMAGARFEFQIADKSAIIADVNYRRLGATADKAIRWASANHLPIEGDFIYVESIPIEGNSHTGRSSNGEIRGNYNKDEILRIVKEADAGVVAEHTKVTLDCISLAVQFKQYVIKGLSARLGLEGTVSLTEKWHYHFYNYYKETGACKEGDKSSDVGDCFSDHLNLAIPLGLTYDYKNFSFNATYHLPLTKCSEDEKWGDKYSMKYQAFDLTIGYRLPLRKR